MRVYIVGSLPRESTPEDKSNFEESCRSIVKYLASERTGIKRYLKKTNSSTKIKMEPYPCASGGTKCCSREGRFVIEQTTNMTLGGHDDRLAPLLDRVPTALRR